MKYSRFLLAPAMAIGLSAALAQQPPTQKLRVAVMDLSGSALKMQSSTSGLGGGMPGVPGGMPGMPGGMQTTTTTTSVAIPAPAEFARGLTEMLGTVLVKSGRFTVLERAAMQQLDQEQALAVGGKTTKETGARTGAMLGAQALITGDITGFSYAKSSMGGKASNLLPGLSVSSDRVTAEVIIDLRLIDPSTSELIYSAKGSGKASQTGVAADLTRDDKSWSANASTATPLGQASRDALAEAVKNLLVGMPKIAWTGRVIDVRDGVVYVNATTADGMKPGLELLVFEQQPALIDPETGKSLGAPERQVGTIVIDAVLEKFSTAKITKGEGIARGLVLRFKAP
jgi:curli biogenesis system outer membrane secretion channel CsgG